MPSVKFILRNRYVRRPWHDKILHLLFWYHRLFYSSLIFRGRKAWAFNALLQIKYGLKCKEEGRDPYTFLVAALIKISPNIILFPIKKAGIVQRTPFPINQSKKITFAVKWVIKLLRDEDRIVKVSTVVDVLSEGYLNAGKAIIKKKSYYQTAASGRHLLRFFR